MAEQKVEKKEKDSAAGVEFDPSKALEAVKDAVLEKLKDMGYKFPYYKPTKNGRVVQRLGGRTITGVVQVSGDEGKDGIYGSILINQMQGLVTGDGPFTLAGFIFKGQTEPYILNVPQGTYRVDLLTQSVENYDATKALEAVKEAVLNKLKDQFGYVPEFYKPTKNGWNEQRIGGHTVTGVVQFSGQEGKSGIYGSILMNQAQGTGTEEPYQLAGFIVGGQTLPYILHVQQGHYQVNSNVIVDDECKQQLSKKLVHAPLSIGPYIFSFQYLPYYDLAFVQGCVELKKTEILEKAGLSEQSIQQFTVTSALCQNLSLRFANFKADIKVGTRNGFEQRILVGFQNSAFDNKQTVTIFDAFYWG